MIIGLIRDIGSKNFISTLLRFRVFQKVNKNSEFEVELYCITCNITVVNSFEKFFFEIFSKRLNKYKQNSTT